MFDRRSALKLVAAGLVANGIGRRAIAAPLTAIDASSDHNILGIDCHTYPGDNAMRDLKTKHHFGVAGFYLTHAPGNVDKSWLGKREFLVSEGWGLFPIYLGSQLASPPAGSGGEHGKEAARLMNTTGFPAGSIAYLDIETPKPENGPFQGYIVEWMKALKDAGFYPGIYCSYTMAPWITKLSRAVWTVELPFAKSRLLMSLPSDEALSNILAYDPLANPHGIIRPDCLATQYQWYQTFSDVRLEPGIKNMFDLNWSKVRDPSSASVVAQTLGLSTLD